MGLAGSEVDDLAAELGADGAGSAGDKEVGRWGDGVKIDSGADRYPGPRLSAAER